MTIEEAAVEWQSARRAFQKLMAETRSGIDDMVRAAAFDRVRDAIRNLDAVLDSRP